MTLIRILRPGVPGLFLLLAAMLCPGHIAVAQQDAMQHDHDAGAMAMPPTLPGAASQPVYQCPMHAHITSEEPGTCPVCGMDLVPAKPAADAAREAVSPTGPAVRPAAGAAQALGVKLGTVEYRSLERRVLAPARVLYDETRVFHLHPRAAGWVEALRLRAEGEPVRKGQVLAEFYSPDILAAQVNFLIARRAATSEAAARDARNLLRLLNVPEDLIGAIERDGETRTRVPILAPEAGVLTRLVARDGMYVEPETEMFTIADLSSVWVLIDLRESESALVRPGQSVTLHFDTLPGKPRQGRIDYLYPELEPSTRVRRARVVLENGDGALQPGLYAEASLVAGGTEAVLAVPRGAVLDDGREQYVLRIADDGAFEPVGISPGRRGDAWIEVGSPLRAGDRIATSAQFLIDAESDLQAELQRLGSRRDPAMPDMHHEH